MTNLIRNPKKNTIITKGIKEKNRNPFSFKADSELTHYLRKYCYDKSKFIKRALHFYLLFINNPKKLMIELKRQNPKLWKYVNRKRFI